MNSLIAYNRNTQQTFWSIVCAGTFSIVATQIGDYEAKELDLEGDAKLKKEGSDHRSFECCDANFRCGDALEQSSFY